MVPRPPGSYPMEGNQMGTDKLSIPIEDEQEWAMDEIESDRELLRAIGVYFDSKGSLTEEEESYLQRIELILTGINKRRG